MSDQRGTSGWSTHPDPSFPGRWCWSAFGQRGATYGSARSQAQAILRAERAMADLEKGPQQ